MSETTQAELEAESAALEVEINELRARRVELSEQIAELHNARQSAEPATGEPQTITPDPVGLGGDAVAPA